MNIKRRSSISGKRREQILAAFVSCVGRYGLHETSVARIAEEAGLQRTLVFHYFSDRRTLIRALIDRLVETHTERCLAALDQTLEDDRLSALLDYYFEGAYFDEFPAAGIAWAEVVAISGRNPEVRAQLREMWDSGLGQLEEYLAKAFPGLDPGRYETVAYAITCLFEYNYLMLVQGLGEERHRQARSAAETLLLTLQQDSS